MRWCILTVVAVCALAAEGEREAAQWVLRKGGSVTLDGQPEPVSRVPDLPEGEVRIHVVDLTGAQLQPEDLKNLAGLSALRELYLPAHMWTPGAGSRLDGNESLAHLKGLYSLRKLQLSIHFLTNINIQDKGMAHLAPLTGLEELRLAQTRVNGKSLAPFVNLKALDLSYSTLDDEGMKSLEGMRKLERLLLRDTLVSDTGIASIEKLTDLVDLDLHGTRITDAGMQRLRGLTRLRRLNLLGAAVTDAGLDALAGMTAMQDLNLYRTQITNAGLARLGHMKNLVALDVRYSRVSNAGVEALRAKAPHAKIAFLDAAAGAPAPPRPPSADARAIAAWAEKIGGRAVIRNGKAVELVLGRCQDQRRARPDARGDKRTRAAGSQYDGGGRRCCRRDRAHDVAAGTRLEPYHDIRYRVGPVGPAHEPACASAKPHARTRTRAFGCREVEPTRRRRADRLSGDRWRPGSPGDARESETLGPGLHGRDERRVPAPRPGPEAA